MCVLDIHTHVLPDVAGTAVVCIGCGPLPQDSGGHLLSAGLHPWDVTGQDDSQLQALKRVLALPQVVAVGECGFDALRGPSRELQEQAFRCQQHLSETFGKPMILHVVREFDTLLRLKKELNPSQQWLVHGFRGGPEQLGQLAAHGIHVSFGIRFNPDSMRAVPLDRLFLETDGNADIGSVLGAASAVLHIPVARLERQIADNVRAFIKTDTQICTIR